jgi:hypothetical protein
MKAKTNTPIVNIEEIAAKIARYFRSFSFIINNKNELTEIIVNIHINTTIKFSKNKGVINFFHPII